MWFSSYNNKKRDEKIKKEESVYKAEREIKHRTEITLRENNAKSKVEQYLSSAFTKKCVEIIKEKIHSKELHLNDLQFQIEKDGIYFGYSQYVGSFSKISLINFRNHGYNNLATETDADAFALAISLLLGVNFEVVYYVPFDREYDCNNTYIVSKQKTTLKDI